MSSPDWSEYVDLTPFDTDAKAIFDKALLYAQTLMPEWIPQAGNIEVAVLEAMAVEAANVAAAANRVPGAVTETILKLFGVERSDGDKATASITVTLNDSGHTLPAGTAFAYFPPDGRRAVAYELDSDLVIAGFSGSGAVTATEVGADHNEPSAGDALQVLATLPYVSSVVFQTTPSGGAWAELDEEFFDRAATTLQSYTSAMSTISQIEAYVLTNHTNAFRAKAYDLSVSADRDTSAAGWVADAHPGNVMIAVGSENSNITDVSDIVLSVAQLQAIEDAVQDRVNASLTVEVVNAELVDVHIEVTVKKTTAAASATVQTAVSAALNEFLAPNNWDWESSVRTNDVISVVSQVSGVDYVVSVDDIDSSSANASKVGGAGSDLSLHYLGSLTYPDSANYVITVT